jgi:hypothetical protein
MPSDEQLREYIVQAVTARFSGASHEQRQKDIREYLAAGRPDVDPATAEALAVHAPALLPGLYRRWARMFAERMFETVPRDQIELLCDKSADNEAALGLAFIMFLESERMERQMAEDLQGLEQAADGRSIDAVAGFILGQREVLEQARQAEMEKKAAAYQESKGKKPH